MITIGATKYTNINILYKYNEWTFYWIYKNFKLSVTQNMCEILVPDDSNALHYSILNLYQAHIYGKAIV